MICCEPDSESRRLQRILMDICMLFVLDWSAEAERHTALPRLTQMRDDIKEYLP